MKCNSKTMLSVGAVLGLAALVSYFAFPAARSLILANSPLLVALICPVSMLLMMWSMRGTKDGAGKTPVASERKSPVAEIGPDNAG